MKKLPEKIITYSLSLEELALALGMINRSDTGRILLQSVYPQISAQEIEARLISASHSLLARELCMMSARKTPILDKRLEMAIFPLVLFDTLMQINLVEGKNRMDARIHIQHGKLFTSHHSISEVVHMIDHGGFDKLPDYIESLFDGFQVELGETRTVGKLTTTVLDLAQEESEQHASSDTERALVENGWSKEDASALSWDLANQTLRGTFSRIFTKQEMSLAEINNAPKKRLLILKSKERNWLFEFPPESSGTGEARLVDQAAFRKAFSAFLNK
jgi:hypothetical protein